jgi:peptide deformylase
MLRNSFMNQKELNNYVTEQKIKKEKGYLTVSERKQLEDIGKNPASYIKIEEIKAREFIVTDINRLKLPCIDVQKDEDISTIVSHLKRALNNFSHKAVGLSANQIGYNKKVSYIRLPISKNKETNKWDYKEYIMINPKIIEKDRSVQIQNESCLSFSGISVNTKRYVFITVEYLNEKMEIQTRVVQDLEALVIQHELDHLNGLTIFDRKWRSE